MSRFIIGFRYAHFLIISIAFFVLAGCATVPSSKERTGTLTVSTYLSDKTIPGVSVFLVKDIDDFPDKLSYASRTGNDGVALFHNIEPGVYFLVAKETVEGGVELGRDLFGYFGGNPLYVKGGDQLKVALPIVMYDGKITRTAGNEKSIITGTVTHEGKGVPDCFVFAFIDSISFFRDPTHAFIAKANGAGYFEVHTPPGSYYLVARKRKSGHFAGPLVMGDHFGYLPENPVEVKEGENIAISLPTIVLKMRNKPIYAKSGVSTITGKIIDEGGNPVKGAYAALYGNPSLLNRPLIISGKTEGDGGFLINVTVPGKYFLGARTGYGGAPMQGDMYGRYEGTVDHSIEVKEGDRIEGIVISVTEVW